MQRISRRTLLKFVGTSITACKAGRVTAQSTQTPRQSNRQFKGTIEKLGHSLLSDPSGAYAAEALRADGKYGIVGSYLGRGGSFLVDLLDPTNPTEVHRVPSAADVLNADVKFDSRNGLYYRVQERATAKAKISGVEIIDYGFERGTPTDPTIISTLESGDTHTLFAHPEEPIVYTVNVYDDGPGMDVWDVTDPANPEKLRKAGPGGALHDLVVDPKRELMHAAYIGTPGLDGYVILDVKDPRRPEEIGRFNYFNEWNYSEAGIEGFENCHYADYDPEREIAIIGDEIAFGVPGGKHIFDIGWDTGSPSEPKPIGFTRSPNAKLMDPDPDNDGEVDETEAFDWTTHNHDVIVKGETTLLVSGDYAEGVVVYDITDPRNPTPTDQYRTDDKANKADGPILEFGPEPVAWGAKYNEQRDFVFASDMITGVYTFKVTADIPDRRSVPL